MTILSRLLVDARSLRRDLNNVHALHRTLMSAFPDENIGEGARKNFEVLYRVEPLQGRHAPILIQSRIEPNWSRLRNDIGSCSQSKPLDGALQAIDIGKRYRFRLRANPTKCEFLGKDQRGKRRSLRGEPAARHWLLGKASSLGFEIPQRKRSECHDWFHDTDPGASEEILHAIDTQVEPHRFGWRNKKPITFASTLFEGTLIVTDPDALRNTIVQGVGSGKAYGFGLLSIAPLR